jgi:small subunit ribosomal protein S8e
MKYQGRSKRTSTGGRVRPHDKKKKHELGREPTETRVGEPKFRTVDVRGSGVKVRALATDVVNVNDGGETTHAEILDVVENPSNPNYARRNIVTKGAIIQVDLDGDEAEARVTSRPGQNGQVNAVLVEDEE